MYNMRMANSLQELLQNKNFDEPPEIKIIKDFLRTHYNSDCDVTVQPQLIVIAVKGAGLAGALRVRLHDLKTLCNTDKRLMIRIV